jgi:tRNA-splicing ligase RtcB
MYTFNGLYTGLPVKVWIDESEDLDDNTFKEAVEISKLPYAKSHIALMPDVHATGYHMPVGGVLATKDVIVPDAVSNDIGCGVAFIQTDIEACFMQTTHMDSGTVAQELVGSIMRDLPTGFQHCKKEENKDNMELLNLINNLNYGGDIEEKPLLMEAVMESMEIVGSLGGGNHFVELQENKEGNLAIMIHTGSRSVGAKINSHFSKLAKSLNKKWYVDVLSDDVTMPFLPLDSDEGQEYMKFMNFALKVAELNRDKIMDLVLNKTIDLLKKRGLIDNYKITRRLNVHHNYAAYENVNGVNYMVHRKGAVRARGTDMVPIPGAMGSSSFIAQGLGNDASFKSCSHGAGRTHTRTAAKEEYSVQEVMEDLKEKNVVLGKTNKKDVAEEYMKAYKDIHQVMENQKDLVSVIDELKTIAVIKG